MRKISEYNMVARNQAWGATIWHDLFAIAADPIMVGVERTGGSFMPKDRPKHGVYLRV